MTKVDPFDEDFVYDSTHQNKDGFLKLPVGRYLAELRSWSAYKNENENIVHQLVFEITAGEFEGEEVRHWQTLLTGKGHDESALRDSIGYFNQMVRNMGLLRDPEDRNSEGKLLFKLDYGPTDGSSSVDVLGVEIPATGETREVLGTECVLVLDHDEDRDSHQVNRIESADDFVPGEAADDGIDWPT